MIYDVIIIGAGAAGLFAGASMTGPVKGLIIEKSSSPGKKLLMSGAGQCNLTRGGSIKDFIPHYGKNGPQIRSILYRFNNQNLIDFFQSRNVPLFERGDGKIFPKSLQSHEVLHCLVDSCINNSLKFIYSSPVTGISLENTKEKALNSEDNVIHTAESKKSNTNVTYDLNSKEPTSIYSVYCGKIFYQTRKLIVTSGGCSYPASGSDGKLFNILKNMGIQINPTRPALVPIHIYDYPFQNLSGISFPKASISIYSRSYESKIAEARDALLLTHNCFSGPAILNISRYAWPEDLISINYYPLKSKDLICKELSKLIVGNSKQLITILYEYFNSGLSKSTVDIPKRFLEVICSRCSTDPTQKSSQVSYTILKSITNLMANDTYCIQSLGGYNIAMVTSGGVSLDEVDKKTLESKIYPNLYFAGEVLDVDGDTGGYNLQFAFSSGNLVAQ